LHGLLLDISKAQFWLFFLLYLFAMTDIFITSIGIQMGFSEANPYLAVFIIHSGVPVFDGFMLVAGGLISTFMMVALAFVVSRIQKMFSLEFFVTALILMHFLGILNWMAIL
jgi:hypothetical protein